MRKRTPGLTALAVTILALGCGTTTTDPGEEPTTGGLTVTVAGLPSGQSADVTVTGPGGFSQALTATQTLAGLAPGTYTISAAAVSGAQGTWAPGSASASATVVAGSTTSSTVAYAEEFGSLEITVSGLPAGVDADVTVDGGGVVRPPVVETTTLTGLRTGEYTILATSVSNGSDSYDPDPASRIVSVLASETTSETVTYALAVPPVNEAPTAEAGGPYSGQVGGAAVALDGTGSSDPDGSIVSYAWTLSPGAVALTGATPSFTCSTSQQYDVTLTVEDDLGETAESSTTLSCVDPAELVLLGRWVDGSGDPIAVVPAGGSAFLQICSMYERTAELSATLTVDPSLATYVDRSELESDAVSGVHPDCVGTTDQLDGLEASDAGAGVLSITRSYAGSPGTGAGVQGIVQVEYSATTDGTITPTLTDVVAADDLGGNLAFTIDAASLAVQSFTWTDVQAGAFVTCGLDEAGAAYCWGANGANQNLGVGSTDQNVLEPLPLINTDVASFTQLVSGNGWMCGLDSGAEAWCWGYNANGQIGNGTQAQFDRPVAVSGDRSYAQLSAGYRNTCGIDLAGATYCWGYNENGWLGTGGPPSITVPTLVAGLPQLDQIANGWWDTCGLAGGTAWCWGENYGTTPVEAAPGYTFTQITVGLYFVCGLAADGTAYCWGQSNGNGQFGNGTTTPSATPTPVLGGPYRTLDAGRYYACGIRTDDEAYCWGENFSLQLGDGGPTGSRLTPTAVAGDHRFSTISALDGHTCGVTTTGQGLCWGAGTTGAIGDGFTDTRAVPTAIRPPS